MVVGEPSLMGGEFGDEDERLITRLENTQYDAANSLDHDNHGGFGHGDSPITVGTNVRQAILFFNRSCIIFYTYQPYNELAYYIIHR